MGVALQLIPDVDQALELLFAHKLEFIREFLRDRELPVSGSKEELRERLRQAVVGDYVSVGEVLLYLDQIEGWGDQHLYLYTVPEVNRPGFPGGSRC
ncbi:MAG: SAP domain-containing protein [bacterium]|nr:SAP domain-containing protein [bacterium]